MNTLLFINNIRPTELLIIVVVILILFGGKKIPELMKGVGKGIRGFKDGIRGIEDEINSDEATKKN